MSGCKNWEHVTNIICVIWYWYDAPHQHLVSLSSHTIIKNCSFCILLLIMYSTTQLHAPTHFNFPASNKNSAPIRNKVHIATLHQLAFIGSDHSMDSSASGHSISLDIDFNIQLTDDTTAYSADFLHLSPPSQGPSSYWGHSESDSQGLSSL
jgi:hypothetical protein